MTFMWTSAKSLGVGVVGSNTNRSHKFNDVGALVLLNVL